VTSVKVDSKSAFKQSDLSKKIDLSEHDKLIKKLGQRETSLILSQGSDHAKAWKHLTFKASKDFYLRPDEFQMSLKVSLGAKVLPEGPPCPFCGKVKIDAYGDHVISCPVAGHVVYTHDAYRDLLLAWCRLAGVDARKEVPVTLKDGSKYRCDLLVALGIPGVTTSQVLLDVTFRSPFTITGLKKASRWSGAAAEMGEDSKNNRLLTALKESNYAFYPVAVETLGGIGTECAPFINYLLTQLHYRLRKPFHEVASIFWQSLSVLVQRMKSNRILRCLQLLHSNEKQKQ
jgi:hypothetical protein